MDSADYQDVLGHRLVPYVQRFPGVSFTFQQDNATIHTSRSTKTWLQDNSVDTMDWPSRSPDLNPMANLWVILVRRIYADNRQFETVKDIQSVICKAWNEVINRNGSWCRDVSGDQSIPPLPSLRSDRFVKVSPWNVAHKNTYMRGNAYHMILADIGFDVLKLVILMSVIDNALGHHKRRRLVLWKHDWEKIRLQT
uniref:DDE_3 domain-containing protein n=1 Tax=Heterorhabditis bacteriophora TaxID=37862 RepID=A0A1I7WX83_HETBA